MPAVHTDLLVRLHVDKSGSVWYGDGGEPATNTFLDPWDFFENEARLEDLDNAKTIRLLGTRDNAPLITKLHERRLADTAFKFKRVELGSPGVVPPAWLRDDPISVLHHIWQLPASSNVAGQWHDMQNVDYATYSMMNTFAETSPGREVPDFTIKIAEYHPTWPAFTFIPTADRHAAARLICDIIDPRWYRHPTHPARLTRLYSHLGLTPQNVLALSGEGQPGHNFNRAKNAVRVWYNLKAQKPGREPGDFLLRLLDGKKGKLTDGLLRGTQRLVAFVCAVWADAIKPPHPEVGFAAARFFKDDPKEARAFDRHVGASKRV